MPLEREYSLVALVKMVSNYYQARMNEDPDFDVWQLGLEIATKAKSIVETEPFNSDAVDELYERFQEVKDKIDGSVSCDLNSVVEGLKRVADAQRKQS